MNDIALSTSNLYHTWDFDLVVFVGLSLAVKVLVVIIETYII
ncbi:hypothetical protein QE403_002831 [Chryseobacterium sp. SORGH_AS 1048]|nr:hypothetical protein [Chryseobacterium sp. SORGH_AS_1048]